MDNTNNDDILRDILREGGSDAESVSFLFLLYYLILKSTFSLTLEEFCFTRLLMNIKV